MRPRLVVHDASGAVVNTPDPLGDAVSALADGRIISVKGLGGFHLACNARRGDVVAELRRRKHRDEKPLAVMVADLAAAAALCELSAAETDLLKSPQRPIVLLKRRADAALAAGIAPGQPLLGLMLPYTPASPLCTTGHPW